MGEYLDGYGHITMYKINIMKKQGSKNGQKTTPPKNPSKTCIISTPIFSCGSKTGRSLESQIIGIWPPKKGSSAPLQQAKSAKKIFSQQFTVYAGMSANPKTTFTAGKSLMHVQKPIMKRIFRSPEWPPPPNSTFLKIDNFEKTTIFDPIFDDFWPLKKTISHRKIL